MLSSLNSMQREKDRLIDISADGMIDNDELGYTSKPFASSIHFIEQ